jgi:hypothetical protein
MLKVINVIDSILPNLAHKSPLERVAVRIKRKFVWDDNHRWDDSMVWDDTLLNQETSGFLASVLWDDALTQNDTRVWHDTDLWADVA